MLVATAPTLSSRARMARLPGQGDAQRCEDRGRRVGDTGLQCRDHPVMPDADDHVELRRERHHGGRGRQPAERDHRVPQPPDGAVRASRVLPRPPGPPPERPAGAARDEADRPPIAGDGGGRHVPAVYTGRQAEVLPGRPGRSRGLPVLVSWDAKWLPVPLGSHPPPLLTRYVSCSNEHAPECRWFRGASLGAFWCGDVRQVDS
jgi:hypothetical protein